MDVIERIERKLARISWQIRDQAEREFGTAEAEKMVGEKMREYMKRYPEERWR